MIGVSHVSPFKLTNEMTHLPFEEMPGKSMLEQIGGLVNSVTKNPILFTMHGGHSGCCVHCGTGVGAGVCCVVGAGVGAGVGHTGE